MGVNESKLSLLTRFNELLQRSDIPESDSLWQALLAPTSSLKQVLSLVSAGDVRQLRMRHPENMETLLNVVVQRITHTLKLSAIGPSVEPELLACVRILVRLLPLAYESQSSEDLAYFERLFWDTNSTGIGPPLCSAIEAMLHFPGLTMPIGQHPQTTLWSPGVAMDARISAPRNIINNRIEVLSLALALLSQPLYSRMPSPAALWLARQEGPECMRVLCSLLNTSLQYTPMPWKRRFDSDILRDPQDVLATLSLQVLAVLVTEAVPAHKGVNHFRRLLSRIHQDKDVLFLERNLVAMIQYNVSPESLALLWELVQSNKKFRLAIVSHPETNTVLCQCLVNTIEYSAHDQRKQDLARLASYVLLDLSAYSDWCSFVNTRAVMTLYRPFNQLDIHIPVYLDILFNFAEHAELLHSESVNLTGFITSLATSEAPEAVQVLDAVYICLRKMLASHRAGNRFLLHQLSQVQTGNEHLSNWIEKLNREPETLQPEYGQEPARFVWTQESLGWYLSVLWARIYQYDIDFWSGIWANTHVRLFKVLNTTSTLNITRPKGAVDATASFVASRLWGAS